ncbi:MAG: GNAT family N-acetyltransferase [Spirochaetes bacterium]|nr:GNAT family N-acetyltransferase [Spirochaetota bacterium]
MEKIDIKKLWFNVDSKLKEKITSIFIDAFYEKDFSLLSRNPHKVYNLFLNAFKYELFFIVYYDLTPVGIFALSDGINRFLKFRIKDFIKNLGLIKGLIAYLFMKYEYEQKIKMKKEGLYIDIIAIKKEFQGMGIGKKIIEFIRNYSIENKKYIELDVNSNNYKAINLYEKNGFIKINEKKIFLLKGLKGFDKKIRMALNINFDI